MPLRGVPSRLEGRIKLENLLAARYPLRFVPVGSSVETYDEGVTALASMRVKTGGRPALLGKAVDLYRLYQAVLACGGACMPALCASPAVALTPLLPRA